MTERKIVYSKDGEDFSYDDPHDIFDSMYACGDLIAGATYYEGVGVQRKPSYYFSIDSLTESMSDAAYDDGGEYAEDFPDASKAQWGELEDSINEWLDKNLSVNFWNVVDVVEREVTQEDIDGYLRNTPE